MTVPTAGYLGISDEELARLLADGLAEEWTLSPEALAAKAKHQLRDAHGRWRDDHGLVPAAVGRRAPGWMDRDVGELRDLVKDVRRDYPKRNLSPSHLREVGERIDKVAKRYSRAHALREERERLDVRMNDLFDTAYDRFSDAGHPDEHNGEPVEDAFVFLSPEERVEYDVTLERYNEAAKELETADAQAYLAVLRRLRPMGGELKVRDDVTIQAEQFAPEELMDIEPRLADALAEVSHVLPTEWLNDINAKGSTGFILSTERAFHRAEADVDAQNAGVELLLSRHGYEFAGYELGVPVVRTDTDQFLAVLPDGTVKAAVLPSGITADVQVTHRLGTRLHERPYEPAPPRNDSTILIDPQQKGTLLHEIAHRVERYYGEQSQMSGYRPMMYSLRSFLDERRKGEQDRPLNEILGSERYMPWEWSFADEFFNPYIGKRYPDATEVLTMGLQHLFYPDFRDYMAKDDDMRRFILGMLAVT